MKTNKRPQNADGMSKSALIREVRALRKETKRLEAKAVVLNYEIKDLKATIERRDRATERYNLIEPLACIFSMAYYPIWKEAGKPDIDACIKNAFTEELAEMAKHQLIDEFWSNRLIDETGRYMELMEVAESLKDEAEKPNDPKDESQIRRAIEGLKDMTDKITMARLKALIIQDIKDLKEKEGN